MFSKPLYLNCILLILLASFSPFTVAENKSDVTLEEASEFIRLQSKGKVLSARTTNFNGSKMHRIQVLSPSGRVKVYQVPGYREANKHSSDYLYNGRRYTQDRSNELNHYYQNNSNRSRNSNTSRYIAPKNYNSPNTSTKGDSKQK